MREICTYKNQCAGYICRWIYFMLAVYKPTFWIFSSPRADSLFGVQRSRELPPFSPNVGNGCSFRNVVFDKPKTVGNARNSNYVNDNILPSESFRLNFNNKIVYVKMIIYSIEFSTGITLVLAIIVLSVAGLSLSDVYDMLRNPFTMLRLPF